MFVGQNHMTFMNANSNHNWQFLKSHEIATDLPFCIHKLSIPFRALKFLSIQKHSTNDVIHSSTILRTTPQTISPKRHHNVSGYVTNKHLHTKTTFLEADNYFSTVFRRKYLAVDKVCLILQKEQCGCSHRLFSPVKKKRNIHIKTVNNAYNLCKHKLKGLQNSIPPVDYHHLSTMIVTTCSLTDLDRCFPTRVPKNPWVPQIIIRGSARNHGINK